MATLQLPAPEPIGTGGLDLHYILLDDDAFALIRRLTSEERIANYRIYRQEGGGEIV